MNIFKQLHYKWLVNKERKYLTKLLQEMETPFHCQQALLYKTYFRNPNLETLTAILMAYHDRDNTLWSTLSSTDFKTIDVDKILKQYLVLSRPIEDFLTTPVDVLTQPLDLLLLKLIVNLNEVESRLLVNLYYDGFLPLTRVKTLHVTKIKSLVNHPSLSNEKHAVQFANHLIKHKLDCYMFTGK